MAKSKSVKIEDFERFRGMSLDELFELKNARDAKAQQLHKKVPYDALNLAIDDRRHAIKRAVMEFEKTNNRHLVFFQSSEKFYLLAERSALFMDMTIADRIRRKVNVLPDRDDYMCATFGTIAIKNLELYQSLFANIDIFEEKEEIFEFPEIRAFRLTKVYTEEAIKHLFEVRRGDAGRFRDVLIPKNLDPKIYNMIREILVQANVVCSHLKPHWYLQSAYLDPIILTAKDLIYAYRRFCREAEVPAQIETLECMVKKCEEIYELGFCLDTMDVIKRDRIQDLMESTIGLANRLKAVAGRKRKYVERKTKSS